MGGGIMTTLWVCGKILSGKDDHWAIGGVFSTEEAAVAACHVEGEYFIGPIQLDQVIPDEPTDWQGAYIPRQMPLLL